jgi:hypothetical protein
MMNKIKSFLMRFYYRFLMDMGFVSAEEFQVCREGLEEVLSRYRSNTILQDANGICSNAGFLGTWGITERSVGSSTFLQMCRIFNFKERKIKTSRTSVYPFSDVDFCRDGLSRWSGASGAVRVRAMEWILGEIEKYGLDKS